MNRLNVINKEICSCRQKILAIYCRSKSYYHALGLDSSASVQEIKTAYYKLSLQHHPDKNDGSEESTAKFREITEAYEILSNPVKKKRYDLESDLRPRYSSGYRAGNRYQSTQRGPYSGKSKDFDYDEHFRQHYENIKKQREAEYEYFKRRWEAEFYRRYPREEYYRDREKPNFESSDQLYRRLQERRKSYMVIAAIWTVIMLFTFSSGYKNPDNLKNNRRIYYHVNSENQEDEDEDSSDGKV